MNTSWPTWALLNPTIRPGKSAFKLLVNYCLALKLNEINLFIKEYNDCASIGK